MEMETPKASETAEVDELANRLSEEIMYARATYPDGSELIFQTTLNVDIMMELGLEITPGTLPVLGASKVRYIDVNEPMFEFYTSPPESRGELNRFARRFISGAH